MGMGEYMDNTFTEDELQDKPEVLKPKISKFFTDVQAEHHTYEEELGQPDEKWAEWYASKLYPKFDNFGYDTSEEQITSLLKEAADKFTSEDDKANWADRYADYFYDKLEKKSNW